MVIPDDDTRLQNIIIKFYHEAAGHAGGPTTWRLIRNKYVWKPGLMKKQIQQFCDGCTTCIRFKSGNHAQYASPRVTIAAPIPFAQIAMDVADMPPTTDGYDGILVIVCCFSSYTVLIPMKSKGLWDKKKHKMVKHNKTTTGAWTAQRMA